jgi:methionyl-tRNA formyltransferase
MTIKFGFAGDRKISVDILDFLINQGFYPDCLFVSDPERATYADQLISRCHFLDKNRIFLGSRIKECTHSPILHSLGLDFIFCIHFPYIIPQSILSIPRHGILNLHPAYLPFNRGWNTPTWAIYDNTPYGATLHFMDASMDTGDIIHQKQLIIKPEDTADSLYQRVLSLEFEIFQEAWPSLLDGTYTVTPQKLATGTMHKKGDITNIQLINLDKPTTARKVINQIRALTTNQDHESAYFEEQGKRYQIKISISIVSQESI